MKAKSKKSFELNKFEGLQIRRHRRIELGNKTKARKEALASGGFEPGGGAGCCCCCSGGGGGY